MAIEHLVGANSFALIVVLFALLAVPATMSVLVGIYNRNKTTLSLGLVFYGICVGLLAIAPSFPSQSGQARVIHCRANLQHIADACEEYASENGGRYPDSLGLLVPRHLRKIPVCPSANADTYSLAYSTSENHASYTVSCGGLHHLDGGIRRRNFPQANGRESSF